MNCMLHKMETPNSRSTFESSVYSCIESESEALADLSSQIHGKPELKFEEVFAHALLTSFLEAKGFTVQRSYHLPTAFRADFSTSGDRTGPTVALLCEYDALPLIGHGCGHNLIAEGSIGAALAVQAVLNENPSLFAKLVVFGTPAEETGGGKIMMMNTGAFDDIDISICAHPSSCNRSAARFSCSFPITANFTGRCAHAAAGPWEGHNALDAAVSAYVNLGLLRQQIRPNWKINVIIKDGGAAVNVIPGTASLELLLRAPVNKEVLELKSKVLRCLKSGAEAASCQVEILERPFSSYEHMSQNSVIERGYRRHSQKAGIELKENILVNPSTDYGNVSQKLPCLHPTFYMGTSSTPHSLEFGTAAGAPEAQPYTRRVAAVMALTLLDFIISPDLVKEAKDAWLVRD